MTSRRAAAGAAVIAVVGAVSLLAPAAQATTTVDKPYIAATGGPVAGCHPGNGVSGACIEVDPGTTVTITIADLATLPVTAYVDVDAQFVRYFCSTGSIAITVPDDSTRHVIGVWPGGANALALLPDCAPGTATMGTVAFTF